MVFLEYMLSKNLQNLHEIQINGCLTCQVDSGSYHDYHYKPMYLITTLLDFSKRPLQPKPSPL